MSISKKTVTTVDELLASAGEAGVPHFVACGDLTGVPTIRLSLGQFLRGEGLPAAISIADGADGHAGQPRARLTSKLSPQRLTLDLPAFLPSCPQRP